MGCTESKVPPRNPRVKPAKPAKIIGKKADTTENNDTSTKTTPVDQSFEAPAKGRLSDMRSAAQSTPPTMFSVSPSLGTAQSPQQWGATGRRESRANEVAIAQINGSPRGRRRSSVYSIASQEDLNNIRMEHTEEAESSMSGDYPQREFRRTRSIDPSFSTTGFMLPPPLTAIQQLRLQPLATLWSEAASLHSGGSLQQSEIKWRMCLCKIDNSDPDCDKIKSLIKCHLAAVLSDAGKLDEAVDLLQSCVYKNEVKNSPDPRDYILHYNLSAGLRDTRFIGKTEVESHTRRAAEGIIKDCGIDSIISYTALSELALVVFEQGLFLFF